MTGFMSLCFLCGGRYYYQPAVNEKYDMGGSTICPICAEAGASAYQPAPVIVREPIRAKWVVRP